MESNTGCQILWLETDGLVLKDGGFCGEGIPSLSLLFSFLGVQKSNFFSENLVSTFLFEIMPCVDNMQYRKLEYKY